MKPLPTKADIRSEMERQIQQYLNQGGAVEDVPRGQSGCENNHNPFSQYSTDRSVQGRTPLAHVVKTLEERKHPATPAKKRPKRRLIKDDFGEPLRWVWVED